MENNMLHASLDKELAFYESICSGDMETVKMTATPLCSEGYGKLSKNSLRNIRYHLIISIAMITRYCINAGMSPEEAYNLSDSYIMKADECRSEDEIRELHSEIIMLFTKRMSRIKVENIYSKQIVKAIDYINSRINEKIAISEVAEHMSLSVSYLSRLFKEEVGINISEYITEKKIETAERLLRLSANSAAEISCMLSFSSQSYFIKVFKKHTGMTPKDYKKRYDFMNNRASSDE